jgi:P27 family predicted phage terminase small subunit
MGRRPKPAAVRSAQGNPGHRPIAEVPSDPRRPRARNSRSAYGKLSSDASRIFGLLSDQLAALNFIRATDEPLLRRYADALARYWRVTRELNEAGGEVYECETTAGGKMLRTRPQFLVQQMLMKRLESMEDRLGLSPMARQQYLLRMAQTGAPSDLFGRAAPGKDSPSHPTASPPAVPPTVSESPVGMLNASRHSLN